jgi:glycerate kinase
VNVVVALDSFKGSIAAADAVAAFAAGWVGVEAATVIVPRPMADGGEGTLAAFGASVPGARRMPVTVDGPHGREVTAEWMLLPDGTGVVELASTSGIELLGDRREPWTAGTRGFGQSIAAALSHGVERLVLGIGSSASTDAGAGLLQALGARLLDAEGSPIGPGLAGLQDLETVDLTPLPALPPGGVTVLTDVTNPLCGATGAAAVFGPQKGLGDDEIPVADALLSHFARLVDGDPDAPGAGAAGGTGFALAAWGADLTPGASAVAGLIALPEAISGADLVVTGEGSFDGQSAAGKVPSYVAGVAGAHGVPVALVAGRIAPDAVTDAFTHAISLTELAGGAAASLADPARWLGEAGATLARRSR